MLTFNIKYFFILSIALKINLLISVQCMSQYVTRRSKCVSLCVLQEWVGE